MHKLPPIQWYQTLFKYYADQYDNEPFVQGTAGEVDFIEQEIGRDQSLTILDIGCGTGRHAIELAKRGYTVTGLDLSPEMLEKAKQKAAAAGVEVSFVQGDARKLPFINQFDQAIMLCEGGFPLMETDEMNFQILESACRSLKAGGKFLFTTLNGLYPLHHSVDAFLEASNGAVDIAKNKLDLMTFRIKSQLEIQGKDGVKRTLDCDQRYYLPSEINWQLKSLGFRDIEIFGAKLGAYSRGDILTHDDYEMLVIARKPTMTLSLRKTTRADLESLFLFQTDPEGIQMAAFTAEDPADKDAYMGKWSKIIENPAIKMETLLLDDVVVGSVVHFDMGDETNVSYWIDRAHWGKGLATAGLKAFIADTDKRPLYARVAFDNFGSQKVLERCGFLRIGSEKGFANARQQEITEFVYRYND